MFPTFIAVARARYLNSIVGVKKNNGQPGPLGVWGGEEGGRLKLDPPDEKEHNYANKEALFLIGEISQQVL